MSRIRIETSLIKVSFPVHKTIICENLAELLSSNQTKKRRPKMNRLSKDISAILGQKEDPPHERLLRMEACRKWKAAAKMRVM